jgi:hypothetical protein
VNIIHLEDKSHINLEFWKLLGGELNIDNLPLGPADEDQGEDLETRMFKLSNTNIGTLEKEKKGGEIEGEERGEGEGEDSEEEGHHSNLVKSMLTTESVFLVEGWGKVFIWVGLKSSVDVKKSSMKCALDYIGKVALTFTLSLDVTFVLIALTLVLT